jgi:hypothetical protein
VEGLGETIVGAERELGNAIGRATGGGEHQNHGGIIGVGDEPAELVAMDAGKVSVKQDDVEGVDVDLGDRLLGVVGDVDGNRLIAQPFGDPVGVAGMSSTTRTLTRWPPRAVGRSWLGA